MSAAGAKESAGAKGSARASASTSAKGSASARASASTSAKGSARDSRCDRHARLRFEHRRNRLEKRYRRLLALYPKDHRREHAEEMVGVLLAAALHNIGHNIGHSIGSDAAANAGGPGPAPVAWARRCWHHAADSTDLIAGALRIRGRMTLNWVRHSRLFAGAVRDPRWSDALAVVSVVAPLLLLVAALAEFDIPQAAASTVSGHPYWPFGSTFFYVSDLPLAIGAPAVTILAFLRLRGLAGIAALATGISQLIVGEAPAFSGDTSPAIAFTVLLAGTAAAALLLSPGPARGLALLKWWGAAGVGAGALVLGGFSVGSNVWFVYAPVPSLASASQGFAAFRSEVAGLPGDLLIAGVLAAVAAACLRTAVSRRTLALLAVPVIPYAILWQEKLAGDLVGPFGGGSAVIPASAVMLYLPPLSLASLIIAGTRLARRRATGRARRVGPAGSSTGPPGALSA
jgi:hypothetical protein